MYILLIELPLTRNLVTEHLLVNLGVRPALSPNFEDHINATIVNTLTILGFIKRNTKTSSSAVCLCMICFSLHWNTVSLPGIFPQQKLQ